MPPKRGNLRVLKQGQSIYGPMAQADLEQLLAQGRISTADQVSIDGGPWRLISAFLAERAAASSPRVAPEMPNNAPYAASSPEKSLQILSGGRIYGPMTRDEVEALLTASRLNVNDLIGAIDGPWMSLADFLAPPGQVDAPYGKLSAADAFRTAQVPQTPPARPNSPPAMPRGMPVPASIEDSEIIDLTADDVVETVSPIQASLDRATMPQVFAPMDSSLLDSLDSVEVVLSTKPEWFVKIRGMPSSHLSQANLKSLIIAREIHAETPTAHFSWADNDWRPFRVVRELADLLKFLPP